MRRRGSIGVAVAGLLLGACSTSGDAIPEVEATGPPSIRADDVANHADQFDTDVPIRPAGSQEELAAATYISGHLQLAGYVVFLDGVPVQDLVRSTNVVARAPSGDAPEVVVMVPYDTTEEFPTDGLALGLFLELARALRVAEGNHGVSFTALGAEHAALGQRNLGSRRAAQELLDDKADPLIVSLARIVEGACIEVSASPGAEVPFGANVDCDPLPASPSQPDVFAEAGFDHVTISGDPIAVGDILLDFLASASD